MAKQTKVCSNLQQDFTDAEKAQARANIGASDGTISWVEYHEGQSIPTVEQSSISVVTSDTGTRIQNGNASKKFYVAPSFTTDDNNKVLTINNSSVQWKALPQGLPPYTASTVGQALFINSSGDPIWAPVPGYYAGDGIRMYVDAMGDTEVSWDYTVGRNLHINQNNQIQTNFPGGIWYAPSAMSNNFNALTNANFAGAYRLACRHNPNETYELALIYTASGSTSTITFIGTETVIGINNDITVNPAAYIGETAYYTPTIRFGYNSSTIFDPTLHKAIIYQGLAQIGPTSNTQIAIWKDNGNVMISFTSIEVGKVGSTL